MAATPPDTPRKTSKGRLQSSAPSPIRIASPSSNNAVLSPRPSPNLTPGTALSPGMTPNPISPNPLGGKGRARDLLRKHYGLGIGVPSPSGNPQDPMDVDSSNFDAKAYYDQLITTSSLPTLLKRENGLTSEIRQLESDRQALVYNHHHELIAASDTIRAMKSRADGLDMDLEKLKAAFSEISRLSAEVTFERGPDKR